MAAFDWQGAVLAVLLGLAMPVLAESLQIDGLSPSGAAGSQGSAAEVLVPRFRLNAKAVLAFSLNDQRVRISPWPAQLPDYLGAQYVAARTVVHPAGPMWIVTFRRAQDAEVWLQLTAGGGQRSQLLPERIVGKIDDGFIYLLDHNKPRRVNVNEPVTLADDEHRRCWRFMLLGTSVPSSAQIEAEPRADWYMRRIACP
ncbi:hypothetical protein WJ07_12375 [Burkholderia vietnamiensis]|uniref:hypothetical protein n=1 Tax=Burkholderia vietnamiensis TaxID=60552 RepID=UPI00075A4FDA|nr:hypothetical protein [Burkholderia vietnamiensis]KVF25221.1 hypothetical protein WJ07_12375 [Burkholderia vietnamiensis]